MSNQTTGQIVLEVVGTVVGAYYGNPGLGFALGSLAGGLIFPPGVPDAPHLQDYQLNTSSYGGPIPLNFGTNRYPGQLIWDGGFEEREEEVTVAKKQTQNQFKVIRSFAMSFCKGPGQITRIWLDGKIWWDASAGGVTGEDASIPPNIIENEAAASVGNIRNFVRDVVHAAPLLSGLRSKAFRFYGGEEDQERDPTMVAKDGEENTPAYRGLCYIVFTDFALQKFGNRIPQIQVEICSARASSCARTPWEVPEDNPLTEVQQDEVGWDRARGRVYEHDDTGATADLRGLRVFSYPGMVQTDYITDLSLGRRYVAYLKSEIGSGGGGGDAFVGAEFIGRDGRLACGKGSGGWGYGIPLVRLSDGTYGSTIDLQKIIDHIVETANGPGFFNGYVAAGSFNVDRITTGLGEVIAALPITTPCGPSPITCSEIGCRNFYDADVGQFLNIVFTVTLICADDLWSGVGTLGWERISDPDGGGLAYYTGPATFTGDAALPCADPQDGHCLSCDPFSYDLRGVSPKGYLYLVHNDTTEYSISVISPSTFGEVAQFQPFKTLDAANHALVPSLYGTPVHVRHMAFVDDKHGQTHVLCCSEDGKALFYSEKEILAGAARLIKDCAVIDEDSFTSACGVLSVGEIDELRIYYLALSNSVMSLYGAKVNTYPNENPPTYVSSGSGNIDRLETYDLATLFPELGAGADARIVAYDGVTHMLIVIVQKPALGYYLVALDIFHLAAAGVISIYWKVFIAAPGSNYNPPYTIPDLSARTFAIGRSGAAGSPSSGAFYQHVLTTGEVTTTQLFSCFPPRCDTEGVQQFYDSRFSAVYVSQKADKSNQPGLYYLGRFAGGLIGLDEIVASICDLCGLTAADYDVSQLAVEQVHGYPVNAIASGRSAMEPLMVSYFFDCVESDYILKFVLRGGSSVATITQPSLIAIQDGDVLRETRTQEIDLPERVVINYTDYYRDYLVGTQESKRISSPYPTQYSGDQLTIQLPIALSPSKAKRIASIIAAASWSSRNRDQLKLPWAYLALDPADPIRINLDDGRQYDLRLSQLDVGLDLTIEGQASEEDSSVYDSSVVAATALGSTQGTADLLSGDVRPIIMGGTLLRDGDDSGGNSSRYYEALIPLTPAQFGGGGIMRSNDGAGYSLRTTLTDAPAQGVLNGPLGDCDTPFTILIDGYFDVRVEYGSAPASASDLDFLAGKNCCAVVASNGDVEWIFFRDVEDLGSGIVRLSYLLRGRRGSEQFCGSHGFDDRVVFLNVVNGTSGLALDSIEISKLDSTVYFDGVAENQAPEDGQKFTQVLEGNDLKPYAPVHIGIELNSDGAGTSILSWARRTRIGGGWRNTTPTVPVGEVSLKFEVDIYDVDGTVVRTLTALDATQVDYTGAQFAEDFPDDTPNEMTVAVYQISATVGRGFAGVAILPVGLTSTAGLGGSGATGGGAVYTVTNAGHRNQQGYRVIYSTDYGFYYGFRYVGSAQSYVNFIRWDTDFTSSLVSGAITGGTPNAGGRALVDIGDQYLYACIGVNGASQIRKVDKASFSLQALMPNLGGLSDVFMFRDLIWDGTDLWTCGANISSAHISIIPQSLSISGVHSVNPGSTAAPSKLAYHAGLNAVFAACEGTREVVRVVKGGSPSVDLRWGFPGTERPRDLIVVNGYLWVLTLQSSPSKTTLKKYEPTTGQLLIEIVSGQAGYGVTMFGDGSDGGVDNQGYYRKQLYTDGRYLFVPGLPGAYVYVIDPANGELKQTIFMGQLTSIEGICNSHLFVGADFVRELG